MKFRLDRSFALRAFGGYMIRAGISVVIAGALLFLSGWLQAVGIAFAVIAVVSVLLALRWIVLKPPAAITLDDDGYRASWRTGGRRCSGTWAGVQRVRLNPDENQLIFEVAGGQAQHFWLGYVGQQQAALQSAIGEYLNKANGYRPLN